MSKYWYDIYGVSAMYGGKLWKPKAKRLCVNRYEIRFVEA